MNLPTLIRQIVDGIERRCLLFTPVKPARSLVILLHGKGGTSSWAVEETRLHEFAYHAGFYLAVPDASRVHLSQEPKFLSNPQFWNSDSLSEYANQLPDDVAYLKSLIDNLARQLSLNPLNVFITGFSNGAAMAFRLAIEASEFIGAIAPVCGHCLNPQLPRLAQPVPTRWLVGVRDPLMPYHGGPVQSPWGSRYTRPALQDELKRWQSVAGKDVEQLAFADLGHHWPGGAGRLNPRIFGPADSSIPGNQLIWDFFQRFEN
jgi:polyhydroxybutyrate depolymerase